MRKIGGCIGTGIYCSLILGNFAGAAELLPGEQITLVFSISCHQIQYFKEDIAC
jgi:hypothetical protein